MSESLQPVPAILETIVPQVIDNHVFTFLPETPMVPMPGQFVEISVAGVGSFPVSACDLVRDDRIVSCIRKVGRVTEALYRLEAGDAVGLRGPFGNGFPLEAFNGRNALLVAGGLGMAPLRGLLQALLADHRHQGRITLLYGSREQGSLLFFDELISLSRQGLINLRFSVDFAETLPGPFERVVCKVGLVSELLEGLDLFPERTTAAVCGPPALYHCVLEELALLGIPASRIYATLERRMRCGIGECCHCVAGGHFVCRDGPVFSLEQLRSMPEAI